MPDGSLLIGFCAAALVVLIIPGPGVLYVIARSLSQGYAAAFISALGLSSGVLVHVAAAAVGLSAILLTSALAFNLIKLIGAGYLIYLGIRMLLSSHQLQSAAPAPARPLPRLFTEGVLVSIFNPKIAIFFLAFLPQFVDPAAGSATWQFVGLGVLYCALALCTDTAYGVLAVLLRNRTGPTRSRMFNYLGGSLLMGLGLRAAWSSQNS